MATKGYESQAESTSVSDLIEILAGYDPEALVVINTGDDNRLTDVIAISTQTQIAASSVRDGRTFYTSDVDDDSSTINAVIFDTK